MLKDSDWTGFRCYCVLLHAHMFNLSDICVCVCADVCLITNVPVILDLDS